MMNILIVGNGFDLAHGLPTKYSHFLTFLKIFIDDNSRSVLRYDNLDERIKKISDTETIDENFNNIIEVIKEAYNDKEINKEINKLISGNIFIKYFVKSSKLGDDWIDFESEISRITKQLELIFNGDSTLTNSKYLLIYDEINRHSSLITQINTYKKDYESLNLGKCKQCVDGFDELFTNSLNNLIRCLEIYLHLCLKVIRITKKSPDISNIKFDKVISFNYTDTYKKAYSADMSNDSLCFIHGKADISNTLETNNMVLGIDEYMSIDKYRYSYMFDNIRKYHQRLYKNTDVIDYGKISGNMFIYGHSLNVTDKDILMELICNENIRRVIIFYHNNESKRTLIANLAKVLGIEEVNRRTRGANRNIEFSKLQAMEIR